MQGEHPDAMVFAVFCASFCSSHKMAKTRQDKAGGPFSLSLLSPLVGTASHRPLLFGCRFLASIAHTNLSLLFPPPSPPSFPSHPFSQCLYTVLLRKHKPGGVENLEAACRDYEKLMDMVPDEKQR